MALTFNGSASNYLLKAISFSADKGTIMAWCRIATDRNDYSTFFQVNSVDNQQFVVQTDSTGTALSVYIYDSNDTGTSLTAGTWYHVALTWDGSTARVYLNGVLDASVTATGSDWNEVRLGTSYWGEPLNGNIAIVKAWDATFTAAQIQQEMYHITPAEMANLKLWLPTFDGSGERNADYSGLSNTLTVYGTITDYPNPPVSWGAPVRVVPFAAAGISGDASITLAAMTASSVGTVSVSGASAVTLAAITTSGAGTVSVVGASAVTLAAVTTSAAGTVAISGAATNTLAAQTIDAAGTVAIAGAASVTLATNTLTVDGTIAIVGAASVVLSAMTLTSAGTVSVTGAASAALAVMTANATGAVVVTGAASITLGTGTLTSAGAVDVTGAAAIVLAALTSKISLSCGRRRRACAGA